MEIFHAKILDMKITLNKENLLSFIQLYNKKWSPNGTAKII